MKWSATARQEELKYVPEHKGDRGKKLLGGGDIPVTFMLSQDARGCIKDRTPGQKYHPNRKPRPELKSYQEREDYGYQRERASPQQEHSEKREVLSRGHNNGGHQEEATKRRLGGTGDYPRCIGIGQV